MRRLLSCICLFLLCISSLFAQQDSLRMGFSVRGVVVDAVTGNPMESVHVRIPGRHHSTVTNADGFFVLKSDSQIPEVECSFMGYRTRRIGTGTSPLRISLQRENLTLDAASIIAGDPRLIVQMAVDQIWESYCTQPEMLECFYRETVRKRNRYTYVAEAVARMYKSRYDGSVYRDAAALEKSRVLVSQRLRDTLSVKTQGGPTMAIGLDAVKYDLVLFNSRDMDLYDYQMEMPTYIGDRLQFVIRIVPAREAPYALYNGLLYIDRELLTFTRIELSLDMRDEQKATADILVHRPVGLRFKPEECSVVINYSMKDGKTRLAYFRSTIRFACDWKKRLFKTHYTSVNELVVTDWDANAEPIPRALRFSSQDCLNDKASEFLDPDFWEDYNIIEPSESLEHAIDRLRKGR